MNSSIHPLAIVTGASSGIGRDLAICCARHGFDLLLAADTDGLEQTAAEVRSEAIDCKVETVFVDLATRDGVDTLWRRLGDRPLAALLANAGHGLGGAFVDQDFDAVRHVIDTNITGTVDLVQRAAIRMTAARSGRMLITGSIAGLMPGSFQAIYNGTKAFVDSFALALRNELKDSGVTVTCLMPGATDTEFFQRAGMTDTRIGQADKADPADVAKIGFDAMMSGEGDVVSGWKNKMQAALASVTPSTVLAEQHRKMAKPGSGRTS